MTEEQPFKRLAILEEMDDYNTAPIESSGSIMEGILREQEGSTGSPTPEPTPEESTPDIAAKKELPSDYLPLNASIQEIIKRQDEQNTILRKELSELRSNFDTVRQPQVQQQQQAANYDPETPANLGHVSQLYQAYTGINQTTQENHKDTAKLRGHLEYMRFKQENPDFNMDPYEIDTTVDRFYKMGQPQAVTGANWRGHFENVFAQTRSAKLTDANKRIADLEKEIETYKKRPAATTTTPVSPAVGKQTSRLSVIDSPTTSVNDKITQLKSFNKRGDFKNFGNDLKKMSGIR